MVRIGVISEARSGSGTSRSGATESTSKNRADHISRLMAQNPLD